MENHNWFSFRPVSKLDQLAETIKITAFIMSEDQHVIQSYVEYKGANFRVVNIVRELEFDILCHQVNIEKTNYAFISLSDLEQGIRDDLWSGLDLFIDCQKTTMYLFQSTVWNELNQLFTDSAVKNPEYGISLNQHTMEEFVERYAFEKLIQEL